MRAVGMLRRCGQYRDIYEHHYKGNAAYGQFLASLQRDDFPRLRRSGQAWRSQVLQTAAKEAAGFVKEKLGVEMELPEEITCGFSEENQQCLKKHCPYYKCT